MNTERDEWCWTLVLLSDISDTICFVQSNITFNISNIRTHTLLISTQCMWWYLCEMLLSRFFLRHFDENTGSPMTHTIAYKYVYCFTDLVFHLNDKWCTNASYGRYSIFRCICSMFLFFVCFLFLSFFKAIFWCVSLHFFRFSFSFFHTQIMT